MKTKERLIIEEALEKAVDEISSDNAYPVFFCDSLVKRMTDSAEAVFDVSMEAQEFYIANGKPEN